MQCRHSRHSRHVRTIEARKTVQTDFPCLCTTCEKTLLLYLLLQKNSETKAEGEYFFSYVQKKWKSWQSSPSNSSGYVLLFPDKSLCRVSNQSVPNVFCVREEIDNEQSFV